MDAVGPRELERLNETRWACQHNACQTVLDRLPAIINVLEEVTAEHSGGRSTDARALLAQIDLQFIAFSWHALRLRWCKMSVWLSTVTLSWFMFSCGSGWSPCGRFSRLQGWIFLSLERSLKYCWDMQSCNMETELVPKERQNITNLDGHTIMSSVGEHPLQTKNMTRWHSWVIYCVLNNMLSELIRCFKKPSCIYATSLRSPVRWLKLGCKKSEFGLKFLIPIQNLDSSLNMKESASKHSMMLDAV